MAEKLGAVVLCLVAEVAAKRFSKIEKIWKNDLVWKKHCTNMHLNTKRI